jgi:hypothetical protein
MALGMDEVIALLELILSVVCGVGRLWYALESLSPFLGGFWGGGAVIVFLWAYNS